MSYVKARVRTTANEALAYTHEKGMDVIILDHHTSEAAPSSES